MTNLPFKRSGMKSAEEVTLRSFVGEVSSLISRNRLKKRHKHRKLVLPKSLDEICHLDIASSMEYLDQIAQISLPSTSQLNPPLPCEDNKMSSLNLPRGAWKECKMNLRCISADRNNLSPLSASLRYGSADGRLNEFRMIPDFRFKASRRVSVADKMVDPKIIEQLVLRYYSFGGVDALYERLLEMKNVKNAEHCLPRASVQGVLNDNVEEIPGEAVDGENAMICDSQDTDKDDFSQRTFLPGPSTRSEISPAETDDSGSSHNTHEMKKPEYKTYLKSDTVVVLVRNNFRNESPLRSSLEEETSLSPVKPCLSLTSASQSHTDTCSPSTSYESPRADCPNENRPRPDSSTVHIIDETNQVYGCEDNTNIGIFGRSGCIRHKERVDVAPPIAL